MDFCYYSFYGGRAGYPLYDTLGLSRFAQVGTGASFGRSVSPSKNGKPDRPVPLLSLPHPSLVNMTGYS